MVIACIKLPDPHNDIGKLFPSLKNTGPIIPPRNTQNTVAAGFMARQDISCKLFLPLMEKSGERGPFPSLPMALQESERYGQKRA